MSRQCANLSQHSTHYTLNYTVDTLHPELYTRHPTPYTPHPRCLTDHHVIAPGSDRLVPRTQAAIIGAFFFFFVTLEPRVEWTKVYEADMRALLGIAFALPRPGQSIILNFTCRICGANPSTIVQIRHLWIETKITPTWWGGPGYLLYIILAITSSVTNCAIISQPGARVD